MESLTKQELFDKYQKEGFPIKSLSDDSIIRYKRKDGRSFRTTIQKHAFIELILENDNIIECEQLILIHEFPSAWINAYRKVQLCKAKP